MSLSLILEEAENAVGDVVVTREDGLMIRVPQAYKQSISEICEKCGVVY